MPRPTSALGLTLTTEDEAVVLFLSGLQEPSVTAFLGHARMLAERGYASLLLEVRAHGESEGDRIALSFHDHRDVRGGGGLPSGPVPVEQGAARGLWSLDGGAKGGERLGKRVWGFRP